MVSSLHTDVSQKSPLLQKDKSQLSALLRGELDWIVLKAIDKDRSRRYPTASQLAADIGRYLNDEPVEATPPSRLYVFRKFARRNRGLLLASTAVVATLLIGIVATGYAAKTAFELKAQAESRERQAIRAATAAGCVDAAFRIRNPSDSPMVGSLRLKTSKRKERKLKQY